MDTLGGLARQVSAKLLRIRDNDPLRRPLGRTPDESIDESLAARGMRRADLFEPAGSLAPHRHRIAAMLAAQGFSPADVAARRWPELKFADHACAYCVDKGRCDRWLRGARKHDYPKMFCVNALTFERWRREDQGSRAAGRPDGDAILEAGIETTRALLKEMRPRATLS